MSSKSSKPLPNTKPGKVPDLFSSKKSSLVQYFSWFSSAGKLAPLIISLFSLVIAIDVRYRPFEGSFYSERMKACTELNEELARFWVTDAELVSMQALADKKSPSKDILVASPPSMTFSESDLTIGIRNKQIGIASSARQFHIFAAGRAQFFTPSEIEILEHIDRELIQSVAEGASIDLSPAGGLSKNILKLRGLCSFLTDGHDFSWLGGKLVK